MKRISPPKNKELLKTLQKMETQRVEYPDELLSARRAAFLDQLAQYEPVEAAEETLQKDQRVIWLLRSLKAIPEKYPPQLLSARRGAYIRRIAWMNWVGIWVALWYALQERITVSTGLSRISTWKTAPAFLVAAGIAVAAFLGFYLYRNQIPVDNAFHSQQGTIHSGRVLTKDTREVKIICKQGYMPPLCLAGEFKRDADLTYQGNGSARPAVAKDTMPSQGSLHMASYANDGLYGPGSSWISNSRNSWIKIDLGRATPINTVKFGQDRLGEFNDRNPGQFVISVALSDNVYANGNSSNDHVEYKDVYMSEQSGFKGTISGAETLTVQFQPRVARYIKITFENKGTAIDEVEAFMVRSPELASNAGVTPKDKSEKDSLPTLVVANTLPPVSTLPSFPISTPTALPATSAPTNTAIPMSTATPVIPTSTPQPTDTEVPASTSTPPPAATDTPIPPATETSEPIYTPIPVYTLIPVYTPMPISTDTPVPVTVPPGLYYMLTPMLPPPIP